MGDFYPMVQVAAVRAPSAFLGRALPTEMAYQIPAAAENDARIFLEGFIPAHSIWRRHQAASDCRRLDAILWRAPCA